MPRKVQEMNRARVSADDAEFSRETLESRIFATQAESQIAVINAQRAQAGLPPIGTKVSELEFRSSGGAIFSLDPVSGLPIVGRIPGDVTLGTSDRIVRFTVPGIIDADVEATYLREKAAGNPPDQAWENTRAAHPAIPLDYEPFSVFNDLNDYRNPRGSYAR